MISLKDTVQITEGFDGILSCVANTSVGYHQQKVHFGSGIVPTLMNFGLKVMYMAVGDKMEHDEGCCLRIEHLRLVILRTCFNVSEVSGTCLDVSRSSSSAGSATGQPVPAETPTALVQNISRFFDINSSSIITKGVVSASTRTQVGCVVSELYAFPRELLPTVPGPSQKSAYVVPLAVSVTALGLLVLGTGAYYWYHKRNLERNLRREQDDELPENGEQNV